MSKYVRKLGIGDWICEGCGSQFRTKKEAQKHAAQCEYIGYLVER